MMKRSKMVSDEMRKGYGEPYPEERCSGRTTGRVFRTIGEAMCRPGEPIKVSDHWHTRVADQFLARLIEQMIADSHLEHFEIVGGYMNPSLVYSVFEEV